MKEFLFEIRAFGLRAAVGNVLINFTKWFIGAKKITITYYRKNNIETHSR